MISLSKIPILSVSLCFLVRERELGWVRYVLSAWSYSGSSDDIGVSWSHVLVKFIFSLTGMFHKSSLFEVGSLFCNDLWIYGFECPVFIESAYIECYLVMIVLSGQLFYSFVSILIYSEDGKLSCGYSSFRGKRASMEDFFDVKSSKIDGQTVCLFGIFDG